MKCYNSFCPFRMNDSNDEYNCVCECCPNKVKTEETYASNRTVMLDDKTKEASSLPLKYRANN